ncbi:hypothetical protein C8R46DRAFT_1184571 [Mycena filopes]|nr:hypothetical protein C8R46DRAFT_1184571 [Mycena filopes]
MPPELIRLPAELLDLIAAQAHLPDLLAFCRTNHALYRICLRWIYSCISPPTPARAVVLFKTLISNKAAAAHIKSISLHLPSDEILFNSFARLMQLAFDNLTSVEALYYSASHHMFSVFSDAHFPRLRDCMIPLCKETSGFLRRHSSLVELYVLLNPGVPANTSYPDLVSIPLPALREFNGPGTVARAVLPDSSADGVVILWDRRVQDEYPPVLEVISRARTPPLKMHNFLQEWDPLLPLALAEHLPQLTHLGFRAVSVHPPAEGSLEVFYDTLGTIVGTFPQLFAIACISYIEHAPPTHADLALEFRVVRAWGRRSATLQSCTLVSNTSWERVDIPGDVWLPRVTSAGHDDREEWRFAWLVGVILRAPAEYPEYADDLAAVLGKEEWEKLLKGS